MVRRRLKINDNLASKLLPLQNITTEEDKDRIIANQAARIKVLEQKIDTLIKLLYGVKSEKINPQGTYT